MDELANFEQQIIDGLEADDQLFRSHAESVCRKNLFTFANNMLQQAVSMLRVSPGQVEQIVAAAKKVYYQYIAPIDLPGVPAFAEPLVDDAIWRVIESLIRKAAEQLSQAAQAS